MLHAESQRESQVAGKTPRSCGIERYLHWRPEKGRWWFRRRVPGKLVEIIGKAEWRQTLTAQSRPEAQREAIRLLDETNRIINLALAGNWPPVSDAEIDLGLVVGFLPHAAT